MFSAPPQLTQQHFSTSGDPVGPVLRCLRPNVPPRWRRPEVCAAGPRDLGRAAGRAGCGVLAEDQAAAAQQPAQPHWRVRFRYSSCMAGTSSFGTYLSIRCIVRCANGPWNLAGAQPCKLMAFAGCTLSAVDDDSLACALLLSDEVHTLSVRMLTHGFLACLQAKCSRGATWTSSRSCVCSTMCMSSQVRYSPLHVQNTCLHRHGHCHMIAGATA